MFEDFSFACTIRRHLYHISLTAMEDSISPSSSRESTPFYESGYNVSQRPLSVTSNAITELSQHFDQHSLTPRRPMLPRDGSTPRAHEQQFTHPSASSFSNRVCRQRQSLNRLQCSSTHLSRISALVEDMVQSTQPLYGPIHSTSMLEDSSSPSLSPDEQTPSATSYFGFTPIAGNGPAIASLHGSAQRSLRHSPSYRIDKELRYNASRDGIGRSQQMVQKKIRMRKSSKHMAAACRKSND